MYHEKQQVKKVFGTNTMGLFVALYLILLAFFIMLNAVSEQTTAQDTDVSSDNSTYTEASNQENLEQYIDDEVDVSEAENDPLLIDLSRSFGAEFNIKGKFSLNDGHVYEAELSANEFFEKGSFNVRADMKPFLKQIAELVMTRNLNENRRVAFMFGTGNGLVSRKMTRSQEIAVRRAGAIARFFKEEGVPDGMFHTGFIPIQENSILAAFRNTPPIVINKFNEENAS